MIERRLAILERALLVIHIVGTGAAALVLAIWPAAIPAAIGVDLHPQQFVLCYFLSGSEAALCFLCIETLRSGQQALRAAAFQILIVLHGFTAALSMLWVLGTANIVVMLNIALRIILILLLALAIRSRPRPR